MRGLLTVGIVTYSQHEMCRNLLAGLKLTVPEETHVFVWNNGPEPFLPSWPGGNVEIIECNENLGYIIPNNRMAAMSRSRWHVVANDDVLVEPGWFEQTLAAFDDPHVAIVGPQSRFGYLDSDFRGQSVQPGRQPDYIEGWWQVWDRRALDRYGLFDETNLTVATCEDSDACLRVRELGWQIRAVPMSIAHVGQASKKAANNHAWGDHNRAYCSRRWARYLAERVFPRHCVNVHGLGAEERKLAEWKYPFSLIHDGP